MADYSGERGEPTASGCGTVSLLFDGYYLKLLTATNSTTVIEAWHARSGKKVNGVFDYSVARQGVANLGPIPAGQYWIQPTQLRENPFYYSSSSWGSHRITIHPRTATNTYSRGGFFIHGGDTFGSAGCIDLATAMSSFAKRLQSQAPSGRVCTAVPENCTIPLLVSYGSESVGDP